MFDLLERHGGGIISAREAQGVYGFLSAGTHPSLYYIRQLRVPVDHGDHVGTQLVADMQFFEKILTYAIASFYNAFSYTVSAYGLPEKQLDALTDRIDTTIPGLFRE